MDTAIKGNPPIVRHGGVRHGGTGNEDSGTGMITFPSNSKMVWIALQNIFAKSIQRCHEKMVLGISLLFHSDNPKHYMSSQDLVDEIVWWKGHRLIKLPSNDFVPFQKPATPAMEGIIDLHHDIIFLFIIILTIVAVLLFGTLDMHYMENYRFMRRHYLLFHYTSKMFRLERKYAKVFFEGINPYYKIRLHYESSIWNLIVSSIHFTLLIFSLCAMQSRNYVWLAYVRNLDNSGTLERIRRIIPSTTPLSKRRVPGSKARHTLLGTIKRCSNIETNFSIEIIWTVIPTLILIIIVIPSFAPLYGMDELIRVCLTVKVIGHQWFWSYEITDKVSFNRKYLAYDRYLVNFNAFDWRRQGAISDTSPVHDVRLMLKSVQYVRDKVNFLNEHISKMPWRKLFNALQLFIDGEEILYASRDYTKVVRFDSYMIPIEDLRYGQHRMYLSVTKSLIVPIKVTIRVLVTSSDVLHSRAIPSLGIKIDAAPGRLNQVCLYLKRHGNFYGQCSEICGVNHAFMPISIKGVRLQAFLRFLQEHYIGSYYPYRKDYLLTHNLFNIVQMRK